MALAITIPQSSAEQLKSGEKTSTYQMKDEIKVGDIVPIIAGDTTKKVKIIDKIWVSDMEMTEEVKTEILKTIPAGTHFNGAFKMVFSYDTEAAPQQQKFEDADQVAAGIDEPELQKPSPEQIADNTEDL